MRRREPAIAPPQGAGRAAAGAPDASVAAPGAVARDQRELAQYRDLFWNLLRAELTVQYNRTALGAVWFILHPILMTAILIVVFQHVVRLGIADYPLFVLSAILPWTYFQTGLVNATMSITRSPALVKRVRIPRMLLPISTIAASLLHFLLFLTVLLACMLAVGSPPPAGVVLLPVIIVLETVFLVGLGLVTCSLNVRYRDVAQVVPVALRLGFYLTPTFYPLSYVPPAWRDLYLLNPMASVVELYRAALVTGGPPSWRVLGTAAASSLATLVVGIAVFLRAEPHFEDHV